MFEGLSTVQIAAAVAGGYLLGSIPFGVIVMRLAGAGDPPSRPVAAVLTVATGAAAGLGIAAAGLGAGLFVGAFGAVFAGGALTLTPVPDKSSAQTPGAPRTAVSNPVPRAFNPLLGMFTPPN